MTVRYETVLWCMHDIHEVGAKKNKPFTFSVCNWRKNSTWNGQCLEHGCRIIGLVKMMFGVLTAFCNKEHNSFIFYSFCPPYLECWKCCTCRLEWSVLLYHPVMRSLSAGCYFSGWSAGCRGCRSVCLCCCFDVSVCLRMSVVLAVHLMCPSPPLQQLLLVDTDSILEAVAVTSLRHCHSSTVFLLYVCTACEVNLCLPLWGKVEC